jgi:hypothetical protein
VADSLTFHTFEGIVVGLSGAVDSEHEQEPWNILAAQDAGLYGAAKLLYESGFDSYYYNEKDVATYVIADEYAVSYFAAGPAWNEISQARDKRFVSHVGLYGHSTGGGKTYDVGKYISEEESALTLDATVYIDATRFPIFAETRHPGSSFHASYYETVDFPHGAATNPGPAKNVDVNVDRNWATPENPVIEHTEIDNVSELHNEVNEDFNANMTR